MADVYEIAERLRQGFLDQAEAYEILNKSRGKWSTLYQQTEREREVYDIARALLAQKAVVEAAVERHEAETDFDDNCGKNIGSMKRMNLFTRTTRAREAFNAAVRAMKEQTR